MPAPKYRNMKTNKEHVLSFSSIKAFSRSPNHFLNYKAGDRIESPAMRLGTAAHCAVLEPDRWKQDYLLCTERKGTKAYKAILETNPKTILLNKSDYDTAQKIRSSLYEEPAARKLIEDATQIETMVYGNIQGLPFRGIVDAATKQYVCDLKTTRDASPREFQRAAYNNSYHVQAAIYCELTGIEDYWIIAAENTAPYNVVPYKIDKYYLKLGRETLYDWIDRFKAWDGSPTGYNPSKERCLILTPPAWAK